MNTTLLASILVLTALAALRPALRPVESRVPAAVFAAWPEEFEGTPLVAEPLLPIEARFAAGFPGATAAFGDGQRRIVMRRIAQATRKVHPIETCLRAGGFAVKPAPARRHPQTGLWGAVLATKDNRTLIVREHIVSRDGAHVWTDASAWYWDALLHPERGPWLAITVIEPGS
jgi:hypothetical protein